MSCCPCWASPFGGATVFESPVILQVIPITHWFTNLGLSIIYILGSSLVLYL